MATLNLSAAALRRANSLTGTQTLANPSVHLRGHRPAPDARHLGNAAAHDTWHNCLTCQRWAACRDPSKRFDYRCTRWQEAAPVDPTFMHSGGTVETIKQAAPTEAKSIEVILSQLNEREQETNLSRMLDEALASGFDVPPDLRIDDRDLPTPANYFEWVRRNDMSGMSNDLFPMQHKIMVEYHGEYCPRCSDVIFLETMHVNSKMSEFESRVVLLENGKCPCCNHTKSEFVASNELPEYYVLNGVAGQRGGKTAVINVSEGYTLAKWVKLPNPQRVFNTLAQQILLGTYCALTFNQVRANLWDPFTQFLTNSPWFQNYHKLLDHFGAKYGQELYDFKDVILRYHHRGLVLAPSGPNKRTMRGATRFSAVVDEIGWFPFGDDNQDKTKMSAEEIHQALENSLATLQAKHESMLRAGHSNLPKPLMSNISSPQELNDMIMKLHRESKGSKTSYTFKLATWEMNPTLPKDCGFLQRKFAVDEDKAMRDFGAEPPMSSAAWMTELKNAAGVFTGPTNNVAVRQYRFDSRSGSPKTSGMAEARLKSNGGRVMALDAGYMNNHFAFAIGRLSDDLPVIESLGEIIPNSKAPVSFTKVFEDVLLPLAQQCGVQVVVSDRWNNIMLLHSLEQQVGAVPLELRCKYPDFEDLRERIYDQTITLPKLEIQPQQVIEQKNEYPSCFMRKPVAHLLYQMLTVRDYPNKTVEKGGGTTDDLFRAVVLALKAMNDPEISVLLNEDSSKRGPIVWGAVSSMTAPGARNTRMGASGARQNFGGGGGGSTVAGKGGVAASRR